MEGGRLMQMALELDPRSGRVPEQEPRNRKTKVWDDDDGSISSLKQILRGSIFLGGTIYRPKGGARRCSRRAHECAPRPAPARVGVVGTSWGPSSSSGSFFES